MQFAICMAVDELPAKRVPLLIAGGNCTCQLPYFLPRSFTLVWIIDALFTRGNIKRFIDGNAEDRKLSQGSVARYHKKPAQYRDALQQQSAFG